MQSLVRNLCVLLAVGVFFQRSSADDLPNVLFIAVDDLRDWVGHLGGHPQAMTPNIDIANNQWGKAVQAYLATISFADAQIGRVLEALEKSEHAENTIIVLWGDHGWHLGEKEHWRKHALWDVSTRTPLIISVTDSEAKGQLCHRQVSLIDLYPTLIDLCGLPERDGLDGQSLKALLKDPSQQWDRPVVMTYGSGNHAVQPQRWRYIRYADGGEELSDHTKDPSEWENLASHSQYKSTIEKLKIHLPEKNK